MWFEPLFDPLGTKVGVKFDNSQHIGPFNDIRVVFKSKNLPPEKYYIVK